MSGTDLTQYIPLPHSQAPPKLSPLQYRGLNFVSREHTPVPGKWYENKDEEETFRVLSVDEDDELVEIEYEDGEIEELVEQGFDVSISLGTVSNREQELSEALASAHAEARQAIAPYTKKLKR